ncbi:putative cytoplasmic protein [Escherichia coli]|uniref:Putative cytoplasmic protein n=1 Tax=Escherichia coli TaxID=562 RepID=A0A376TG37_ECOLX|nr:putative cytoplasmic protein [Escherichia coli]
MSHLDEVIARVDAAIEESVIAHMNELLIALSDDAELSREDRYTQQQRLRPLLLITVASIKKIWKRATNS